MVIPQITAYKYLSLFYECFNECYMIIFFFFFNFLMNIIDAI